MSDAVKSSSAQRIALLTRSMNYALLLVGSLLFALPFINMVATSMKLDEEMGSDQFHILPSAPIARHRSPYAMEETDYHIERPADMNRATWDVLRPQLEAAVAGIVGQWWDRQPQLATAFAPVDRTAGIRTLLPVVTTSVINQISDSARTAGVEAMLAEAVKLTDDQKIQDAFDQYIPRFCLGDVRVRLADYTTVSAVRPADWHVSTGHAGIFDLGPPLAINGQSTRVLQWSEPAGSPVAVTASSTAIKPDTAQSISRVYVSYRSDQSWCRIGVTLICAGRRYEQTESEFAADRKWTELELRIPNREIEQRDGRTYLRLRDAGPARSTDPAFAIALNLTPNTTAGAWWAKASRNYLVAFRRVPIARYIGTSIALAILSIILTVFGSSLSAYAFARIQFPGRDALFGLLLATMMIPGQVTMIPSFLITKQLGWYNTLYPLWVPAMFGSAFYIFMTRQFFLSIPRELEEAARIDGCGFLRIYWHVMLPLTRPTLVTVTIFAFMGSWNNFMGPLIYVNDERLYNLAFGLYKFQLDSGQNASLMMAGSFVMTIPIIAMFFFFQRYFVQGIAISGLGGK